MLFETLDLLKRRLECALRADAVDADRTGVPTGNKRLELLDILVTHLHAK